MSLMYERLVNNGHWVNHDKYNQMPNVPIVVVDSVYDSIYENSMETTLRWSDFPTWKPALNEVFYEWSSKHWNVRDSVGVLVSVYNTDDPSTEMALLGAGFPGTREDNQAGAEVVRRARWVYFIRIYEEVRRTCYLSAEIMYGVLENGYKIDGFSTGLIGPYTLTDDQDREAKFLIMSTVPVITLANAFLSSDGLPPTKNLNPKLVKKHTRKGRKTFPHHKLEISISAPEGVAKYLRLNKEQFSENNVAEGLTLEPLPIDAKELIEARK